MGEIHAADGEVLAISVDTVEQNADVAKKLGLEFPVLSDTELQAIKAFGLLHAGASMEGANIARPGVFILDRTGAVAFRDLTDNWRVRVRPERVLDELRKIP